VNRFAIALTANERVFCVSEREKNEKKEREVIRRGISSRDIQMKNI
jgi:hypothetical protein